jgi:hypothetical protein
LFIREKLLFCQALLHSHFSGQAKMLICLWKGCEHVFEEIAAFQEHVNKHVQQQQHQHNLDNHKNVAANEEVEAEERPIIKMNQDEEKKKKHFGGKR